VNTDAQMVAIHGYDTVAYFTDGRPEKGDARYAVDYNGVHYDFASQDHADKFRADPAAYVPQYGGFCSIGTSYGQKIDIDPLAWRIVGGKLYLNFDPGVQKLFNKDVPGTISRANEQWPLIKGNVPHQ
jgi:YHS domain-containing protein